MKKSMIAAGAASVALAAMPIVSTFATNVRNITDTVQLELGLSCSMAVAPTTGQTGITITTDPASPTTEADITGVTYAGTLAAGNAMEITGTAMGIACNDTGGWKINAVGVGTSTSGTVTSMAASTSDSDDVATGVTALDGTVSEWAFRIAASSSTYATIKPNGVTGQTYADDSVIPATSTEIVGFADPIASDAPVTITPTYHVSFAPTQPAATYTGKINYTLVHPEA